MKGLTDHDWRMAWDSQSACNLSGIVFQFARTMQRICDEEPRLDTAGKAAHPICRLYAEQIMFLTCAGSGDVASYSKAYAAVRQRVEEQIA